MPSVVETVDAGRIWIEPDLVAGAQAEFARGPDRDAADVTLDIEERVAAQVLGNGNSARPALPIAVDHDVLRPDADRGRTELSGDVLLRYEIHFGRADEARDENVGRAFVKFERRAELLDMPGIEHHDLVGHGHGLDLVMRDIDRGGAERLLQACDLEPHLHPQRRIEVGQWLVEKKGLRLAHDCPADRHPLALAA